MSGPSDDDRTGGGGSGSDDDDWTGGGGPGSDDDTPVAGVAIVPDTAHDDDDHDHDHERHDHERHDHDGEDAVRVGTAPVWTRDDWYVCFGLFLVSLLFVGLHQMSYETLSPIDELQHVDYVIRAGEFDIPRGREVVGQEALAEAACRSVDSPGYEGPPCGLAEYDPANFQENGINTSASQFPPYYVVTGLAARGLTEIGIFDSKVTAARTLGAVWAGAAWSVAWYLMALLGIRRRARAVALALLLVTPLTIFHAGATVNADVSLMLTGALAVLATIKYESGRLRWWWLPPIYAGLLFVEATNILAIAACGAYLIFRQGLNSTLPWRVRLAPLLIPPVLFLFRTEVTGRVHDALFPSAPRQRVDGQVVRAPMFTNHRIDEVSIDKVLGQLPSTFTPVHNPYFSPPLRSQLTIAGVQLTNWLLIGLMFTTAVILAANARTAWWARVTIAALLAAGPFYTFYFAYFSNQDFPAPARFALPLVPLMVVVVAAAIEQGRAFWVATTVAAGCAANTIYQLVTAL